MTHCQLLHKNRRYFSRMEVLYGLLNFFLVKDGHCEAGNGDELFFWSINFNFPDLGRFPQMEGMGDSSDHPTPYGAQMIDIDFEANRYLMGIETTVCGDTADCFGKSA